jgi:hypothetical protein
MRLVARRDGAPRLEGFAPDERVVSWADTPDGDAVIATTHGLWWPAAGDTAETRRIAWQHIDKATWRDGALTVIEADVLDDELLIDRAPVSRTLSAPRDLPPTVRKRVEANIARNELVTVPGGAVRFVARRVPGVDGLAWWARLEPGTPLTEDVRRAVRARLELLRANSGA